MTRPLDVFVIYRPRRQRYEVQRWLIRNTPLNHDALPAETIDLAPSLEMARKAIPAGRVETTHSIPAGLTAYFSDPEILEVWQ